MKIKKMLGMLVVLLIAVFVVACSNNDNGSGNNVKDDTDNNGSSSSAEESVKLRISTGLPDSHQWMLGYFNPMLEEIEEKSGDLLTYDLFTSGELVATTEELEGLNSGTIDVAIPLHPIYDPERFPLSEMTMLPVLESNVEIATKAFENLINSEEEFLDGKTYKEYVYGDKDLKVFTMVSTQPYVIGTTKKEITSTDDLKGLKIRSGSRVHDIFLNKIGASPISLPFTDLYDGLSKGTLDGSSLAIPDWTSYGIEKLFKYTITGINLGHYSAVTAMTMDTWNSLPETVQNAFEEAAVNQLQSGIDNWYKVNDDTVALSEENGGQFVDISELDSGLQEVFEKSITETWEQWIEDVESSGHPGKEAAILWRDLFVEAGGKVPDAIMEIE